MRILDIPSGGVYTYTRDCDDEPDREDKCTEEGTSQGGVIQMKVNKFQNAVYSDLQGLLLLHWFV